MDIFNDLVYDFVAGFKIGRLAPARHVEDLLFRHVHHRFHVAGILHPFLGDILRGFN